MHLVASSEGMALFIKSARLIEEEICLSDEQRKKCGLLLSFARAKFEFALKSITDSVQTLLNLAKVLYYLACYSPEKASYLSRSQSDEFTSCQTNETSKVKLLTASLKHYEQSINILKKRSNTIALFNMKRKKQSKGDLSGTMTLKLDLHAAGEERQVKKQNDVDRDLLCKATLEMLTVICESSLCLPPKPGSAFPRERRRMWGMAWDSLQEVLVKHPAKLNLEIKETIVNLVRNHSSHSKSERNDCKLFNYIEVGRLGVIISCILQLESLRITEERFLQQYYQDRSLFKSGTTALAWSGVSEPKALPKAQKKNAREARPKSLRDSGHLIKFISDMESEEKQPRKQSVPPMPLKEKEIGGDKSGECTNRLRQSEEDGSENCISTLPKLCSNSSEGSSESEGEVAKNATIGGILGPRHKPWNSKPSASAKKEITDGSEVSDDNNSAYLKGKLSLRKLHARAISFCLRGFHNLDSLVPECIRYDRSFVSMFKERARWRYSENQAFPFIFSTWESTFYDPDTVEEDKKRDWKEWKKLKTRQKSWHAAALYLDEDIFLSWGGRYLAARNDGTVYLTPGHHIFLPKPSLAAERGRKSHACVSVQWSIGTLPGESTLAKQSSPTV